MAGDEPVDREVGDDVTIVNEDGVALDPIGDVFNTATSFEEGRFVEERQLGSAIGSLRESFLPCFVEVMSVDGEVGNSGIEAVVEDVGDERAIGEGDEGFGQGIGEGLQACAQSSSEKKCFPHR